MKKVLKILSWILCGIVVSIVLSVVYYSLFALVFSSDMDKVLMEENMLYEKYLPQMKENAGLMASEIQFLKGRDAHIYRSVFKTEVPSVSEVDRGVEHALESAGKIEDCWREIFDTLAVANFVMPPMIAPIEDLNYRSIGASVGGKLSPFYKLNFMHDGLDIIAPLGTPVVATESGVVTAVQTALGGKGNMVTIKHDGGYSTVYAHMSKIFVKKGKKVKRGERIGLVGDSGRSFTTHLHYEVRKDGEPLDPTSCFFGQVSEDEYFKILMKSASSAQSMD